MLPICVWIVVAGCTGKDAPQQNIGAKDLLAERIDDIGLRRFGEIRTYAGDSLYQYLDGGAEIYLGHNCTDLATAEYGRDSAQFVVDIYRFKTAPDAFAMYTIFRLPDQETLAIGDEGFRDGSSLEFVRGAFLIRLIGLDNAPGLDDDLLAFARWLDRQTTPPKK